MVEKNKVEALAHVKIKGHTNGTVQIYINDRLVPGVTGYRIEHNASDKRVPHLILEVQCDLEMDTGAIPLLPEPWSWFYQPKYPNWVSEKDYFKFLTEEAGTK